MKNAIFLSYRREDSGGYTRALHQALVKEFDSESIFMDVDTVGPGVDFVQYTQQAIDKCNVLIPVIGRNWLSAASEHGRRLDDPNDYVRCEIELALEKNILVIPLLVDGARMPKSDQLPGDLAPLAHRNALELRDLHFEADVNRLVDALKQALGSSVSPPGDTEVKRPDIGGQKSFNTAWMVLAGVVVVSVIVAGMYAVKKQSSPKMVVSGDVTATAGPDGIAVVTTGDVTINERDPLVQEALDGLLRILETVSEKDGQIASLQQRVRDLEDAGKGIVQAVMAIPGQTEIPNADARIKRALEQAANGQNPEESESIFQDVFEREIAKGKAALEQGDAAFKNAAEAARHLGALAFLHDTDKALNAYRQAVNYDPKNPDGWNQLGRLYRRVGQLDEAERAYKRVLQLGKSSSNSDWIAIAYANLGAIYQTRGELKEAEDAYRKALVFNESLDRKDRMAANYGNLGLVYHTRGELELAEELQKKALEINRSLGNEHGKAYSYINLGRIYETRDEWERAEAMYLEARDICESIGNKEGLAIAFSNLGNVFKARGELKQAETYVREALKINETLGREQGKAKNYDSLGSIYHGHGELAKAEEMYQRALKINESIGRKEGIADNYATLGLIYQNRGELARAEVMYSKALDINHKLRRKEGIADNFDGLGRVFETRGELSKGIALYSKALEINEELDRKESIAWDCNALAWLYATSSIDGLRDGPRAVELANRAAVIKASAEYLDTLAAALAEVGQFEDAVEIQEQAISKLRDTDSTLGGYEKRLALYRDGIPWREGN